MGYRKINNLYKDIRILEFKECYAMEKIHGTSAHVKFRDGQITYHSGGAKHENFVELFDEEDLKARFAELGHPHATTVYGEACGGKMQKMSETYGPDLRFIAFEVQMGDTWLTVPDAENVATKLGLDFVDYARGPAEVSWLNKQRDRPSSLAQKLGLGEKKREGIVIRPLSEHLDYRGNRIITKHKADEFRETKTKREVDPEKLQRLKDAQAVADEWVVPMRLAHVLDKMPVKGEMEHIPLVIKAMIDDVRMESDGEVEWSKDVEKAIAKNTAMLYKKGISQI